MLTFPKSARVRTRRQYQRISQNHIRHVGTWIVMEARYTNNTMTRLGITVTRRYGNAVHRNRFKRVVREAFRLGRGDLPQGYDLNIKPRTVAYKATTADILAELKSFAQPQT